MALRARAGEMSAYILCLFPSARVALAEGKDRGGRSSGNVGAALRLESAGRAAAHPVL